MIRTGKDEFFIEPLDQWKPGEEEEGDGGQKHIIYRSSAIITNQADVNQSQGVNQSPDDFVRGEKNQHSEITQVNPSCLCWSLIT